MWLSLNIISDLVNINGISPEDIAYKLTMSTAEFEGIEYINYHLNAVIAVKILGISPHPNADKLTLVDLDTGKEEIQVVCGASNYKKGDIVALATPGAKFNQDFTIKESKIRGEKSSGMLCSEKELGISEDHSGIMILPKDTQIGATLDTLFQHWIDVILEIDNKSITNRPDLWSHLGFAREISAIFNREIKKIENTEIQKTFENKDHLAVRIENPEHCSRYCGLVVKNIKIDESPDWLKAKVSSIGMRPINNIVDITNYVMAEIGEPMHAFDRKKLSGSDIFVRMAKKGEIIETLDEQTHELSADDIVIADEDGPIALAGVMGGARSEIDRSTNEIVLEAANFNAVTIRKTSGKFGLRTEAAIRFEKSQDSELCDKAIIRCYELIKKLIPDAEATTKIVDAYPVKNDRVTINLNTDFIKKKIGDNISDEKIVSILEALGYKISKNKNKLKIIAPTYRATGDISIQDDIVEEVGRIYGYGNIAPKAPFVPCATPIVNRKRLLERKIKEILTKDHHLSEVRNYSFVGEDLLNRVECNEGKELKLQNPLSREQDRLRTSLIPGLLTNIELNQRYCAAFQFFELGRIYLKDKILSSELAAENTRISGSLYTHSPAQPLFYSAKTIIKDLLEQLNIKNILYSPKDNSLPAYAHPVRSMEIKIDKKDAGLIFELHPKITKKFGIKGEVAMFDIDVDIILNCAKKENCFIDLPRFPDVPFEISILADKHCYAAEILSVIEKNNKKYLKSINVISIYEGDPIPEGKKSISIKIVFSSKDRTLPSEEIDNLQKHVIRALNKEGFKLR